ncbi:MAG: efflux RND transporter permease subunit [Tannerellaceae bacterium]|jgi:multidrug efflux pump subunit AcrB|nr:efflux RND transporter permease subunit [Tannerellaceae bacterium]
MIRFLLHRPIAVLMAFTAVFIIGVTTYFTLPVSLLPDIAIPEITVQVTAANTSARELENIVVKPIRQQLMQVGRLRNIRSETRDGAGLLRMSFDFGTNTDLAFIEVNEKIDAAMNYLPRDVERPRVIKASATDIPVFCLNLTLKEQDSADETQFLTLCEFAENVIKRRIEQLPEVAMVDVTGTASKQVQIIPDMKRLNAAGLSLDDLEQAIASNNIEPGSMTVRDGYYEYNIRFSSLLRTEDDVRNIYIRKDNRILRLKDLAEVSVSAVKEAGFSLAGGKRAVTLAVIKQSEENMDKMKTSLQEVIDYFSSVYPGIAFSVTRNQTELLDYTISNLKQNLSLGFLFIFVVAIFFLGDVKSPVVIGISMVVSLVVCFLFFYFFHLSLNIISLAGLILALGMMIDSSIVVTENIAQYQARGHTLEDACDKGTTEVITPMLSSTLTTIVVFVPLVFMSGIAGAIFYDQAFAVTIGLIVSYFTGIMLLPVLYKIASPKLSGKAAKPPKVARNFSVYDAGVRFVFRHKFSSVAILFVSIPLCVLLFYEVPKSRMPDIEQNELIALIDWNENIHLNENRQRVETLFAATVNDPMEYTAYVGRQDFLLNRDGELSQSEAELYFKTPHTSDIAPLQHEIEQWIKEHFPTAAVSFQPPETVFEKLFVTAEADVVAELSPRNKSQAPAPESIHALETSMRETAENAPAGIPFDNQLNITINRRKLLLYNVDYNTVYQSLRTTFKDNEIGLLRSYQQYLPIVVAGGEQTVHEMMQSTLVRTAGGETVPLFAFVTITPGEDLKTITAGKNGEFIPFRFYDVTDADRLMRDVRQNVEQSTVDETGSQAWDIDFSGSVFSNRRMLNELVVILLVSLLLMYFILAAQFESFIQPLVVLLEIPIDVAAALVLLWLCGHTLNLMSAIGIVVTCSIIINDSILKLDAINSLRKEGLPLTEAIHEAGRRRLRPIVMTSLTSILAMVPLLFSSDMGSELQKPLSISIIATMIIGTAVSLFIIPLVYWLIYRKEETTRHTEL